MNAPAPFPSVIDGALIATLTAALHTAHCQIKLDRDSAFDCAYNHAEGCITDPQDRAFVDEYDQVLAEIDLAIAAAESHAAPLPFYGLVLYQRHPVGGWRVFDACPFDEPEQPLPLGKFSIQHPKGHSLLGVTGTFRREPRIGQWCKRPHKELAHV